MPLCSRSPAPDQEQYRQMKLALAAREPSVSFRRGAKLLCDGCTWRPVVAGKEFAAVEPPKPAGSRRTKPASGVLLSPSWRSFDPIDRYPLCVNIGAGTARQALLLNTLEPPGSDSAAPKGRQLQPAPASRRTVALVVKSQLTWRPTSGFTAQLRAPDSAWPPEPVRPSRSGTSARCSVRARA